MGQSKWVHCYKTKNKFWEAPQPPIYSIDLTIGNSIGIH